MHSEFKQKWLPVVVVAGALAAWAILLSLGAFLAPADEAQAKDPRKLLMVAATMGLFLLLWALVLWIRVAKVRRRGRRDNDQ
ncbi:MAG: hypothetical protein MK171_06955 [Pirellulales bacterium]|nr:hypothetical protein [Pirellulales bacterium]